MRRNQVKDNRNWARCIILLCIACFVAVVGDPSASAQVGHEFDDDQTDNKFDASRGPILIDIYDQVSLLLSESPRRCGKHIVCASLSEMRRGVLKIESYVGFFLNVALGSKRGACLLCRAGYYEGRCLASGSSVRLSNQERSDVFRKKSYSVSRRLEMYRPETEFYSYSRTLTLLMKGYCEDGSSEVFFKVLNGESTFTIANRYGLSPLFFSGTFYPRKYILASIFSENYPDGREELVCVQTRSFTPCSDLKLENRTTFLNPAIFAIAFPDHARGFDMLELN